MLLLLLGEVGEVVIHVGGEGGEAHRPEHWSQPRRGEKSSKRRCLRSGKAKHAAAKFAKHNYGVELVI
jgi:hypothetical protein